METTQDNFLSAAYGLVFESEIRLPELIAIPRPHAGQPPDVHIRIGCARPDTTQPGTQIGPFLWTSTRELSLQVPNIARFLVRDGREIWIEPEDASDEDSVRVFLLGAVFGALLHQRGFLVLHGNAIRIGDHCMVCIGPSGAGKSTLAAEFMRRGHRVLADDVVAVDPQGEAMPGFPRIKLWQDAADRLQINTDGLLRVRPNMEKFNYPLTEKFADAALPLRWVYILRTHNADEMRFEPVSGAARFSALRNNTYRPRFLSGMGLEARNLTLCSELSGRIKLTRVLRPEGGCTPDALAESILNDIDANA
jgi:hypothetical protein